MDEEYNRYWKTVIETMMDGLMVVSEDGTIVSINKAMEQLTGYTREELVGKSCEILNCDICFKSRARGKDKYCALFRKGLVEKRKCTVDNKLGRVIPILKNARVLKDDAGNVIGGVETLTDLSQIEAKDREISRLRRKLSQGDGFHGMLGKSPAITRVFHLISNAAESAAPVLIYGESGTGKELAALAIHRLGARKAGPLIRVNVAALNESLLESELFGHVKGAFTGADRTRVGRFEAADGGDIFLDEIGDLPPATQVKLLRVLQERVIEKVGDQQPVPVDVRIITATNKNLERLMAEGRFREDLYYRIAVIPVRIPPLRERMEDLPLLIEEFIHRIALKNDRRIIGMKKETLELLMNHHWPGNIRELINVMEYTFVLCPGDEIHPEHLPEYLTGNGSGPAPGLKSGRQGARPSREKLLEALTQAGGKKVEAARILGVSRVTLWKWLKNHNIHPPTAVVHDD
ncbi:MAG: sigma 54-interacting transcriptional regulator [Deltaproteobacteria bacterium]|nr:sigma 54-interacting transcriptional regulator [Deltaproteobacteria bacterium]